MPKQKGLTPTCLFGHQALKIEWAKKLESMQKSKLWYQHNAPAPKDLRVWRAREEEKLTWLTIASRFYPADCKYERGTGKSWASDPGVGKARRAHARVEAYFTEEQQGERTQEQVRQERRLEELGYSPRVIRSLFGVSPDIFEDHFSSSRAATPAAPGPGSRTGRGVGPERTAGGARAPERRTARA